MNGIKICPNCQTQLIANEDVAQFSDFIEKRAESQAKKLFVGLNKTLVEALEWYANPENHKPIEEFGGFWGTTTQVDYDAGAKAREVLANLKGK